MNRFRFWSRRAWLLHSYLLATLLLPPFPLANSYWSDTDSDGMMDSWTDQNNSTQSLAQLDTQNIDVDGDGAYNDEELAYGSDPLDYDTDDDGLNDGDEIHLAIQGGGNAYSLTAWDSNGDGVSDFDDFYNCFSVTYPYGQLPSFAGASYSDYDGDGIKNPFDAYPTDPTNNDADGDGLDDSTDPAPGDASNTSPYNSMSWGSDALGDADNDAILNFWDSYPYDSGNGSNDSDGDGIDNTSDPFPSDYSNYSSLNGINWYGDVFGDADGDSVQNFADEWPYDASNGNSSNGNNSNDDDNDGITNELDPAPSDPNNYSSSNGYNWYGSALEDADNDGTNNFDDSYPYDPYNGLTDADNDGWDNAADPFPTDASNFSSFNQTAWGDTLFEDADGDGTPNWQDAYPYDPYDNNPDFDSDGIPNESDPYPADGSNFSPVNQIAWGTNVLGDDDTDGTANWLDESPYPITTGPIDSDSDGYDDASDPAPNDTSNYSSYNSTSWGGDVFGDADTDGVQNFWDQWPYDASNGTPTITDSDSDGIPDDTDPAPSDSANYSTYNWQAWYGSALNDDDNDGVANFYDPQPNGENTNNNNVDGDGYDDSIDPAPNDSSNYSPYNANWWYNDVFGDTDGDGIQNFWDQWPNDFNNGYDNTNFDSDGDGISNDVDPAPGDWSNYSSHNSQNWFSDALGDSDNDNILNFYDYNPYVDDNADSDIDGLLDTNDPAPNDPNNVSPYNNLAWPTGALNDDDSDSILNFYDDTPHGVSPPVDSDGDGLYSGEEQAWGTSDSNTDSDGDGLSDGDEVHIHGTNPANAHSISQSRGWGDLYSDADLVDDIDSDGDDIPDCIELHYGLNPNWAIDALLDRDNNGINNVTQYLAGMALDTNLSTYDDDGDGMTDVFEDAWQLQKTNAADAVLDADGDGVLNYEEQRLLLSPRNADTLQQGGLGDLLQLMLSVRYPDGSNPPASETALHNGIPHWAAAVKSNPTAPDFDHFTRQPTIDLDGDGIPDPDLDGDGMPDAWEHQYGAWKYPLGGLNLRDARDALLDPDLDGLNNLTEFRFDSNPLVRDSLHDGVSDATRLYNQGYTSTTTTSGSTMVGGLMSRYRAQAVQQDLLPGIVSPPVLDGGNSEVDRSPKPLIYVTVHNEYQTEAAGTVSYDSTTTSTGSAECYVQKWVGNPVCSCTFVDHTITCPKCYGINSTSPCRGCQGTKSSDCDKCYASGTMPCEGSHVDYDPETGETYTCVACGGVGSVGCDRCASSGKMACTTCDPDGLIHCGRCGGSGRVDDSSGMNSQTVDPSCPYHGTNATLTGDPSTEPSGSGSTSVKLELKFPPGSEAHLGECYRVMRDGEPYSMLSSQTPLVSIPAPSAGRKDVSVYLIEDATSTISVNDSAGPRYRKIGLNGMPLGDAKPQSQDESGENPEETYIDAYSRQLRHSVSDVYASAEGSLLPLMVRRDVQSESFNGHSGLRPHEKPDTPFGVGWTSNVCSFVRFESLGEQSNAGVKAVVGDELGAKQSFYLLNSSNFWVHSKEEVLDAKTAKNTFAANAFSLDSPQIYTGVTLFKKFGTTCTYEMIPALSQWVSHNRLSNSGGTSLYTYARLSMVQDRLGNRLIYTYPSTNTLIPSRISDPDRPGRSLSITQSGNVITSIRGPDGRTTSFHYSPWGSQRAVMLSSVEKGSHFVHYGYDMEVETDPTPDAGTAPTLLTHVDLSSITDELGREYQLLRGGFDHSNMFQVSHGSAGGTSVINKVQTGIPRPVAEIVLPDATPATPATPTTPAIPAIPATHVTLTGGRGIHSLLQVPYVLVQSLPWTQSTGPAGTYRFEFSEPRADLSALFANSFMTADVDPCSASIVLNFTKLKVTSAAGDETYVFSPESAMALTSSTDCSGNKTTFTYGTDGYDDPLTEKDAQGGIKTFTYDPATRIMTSMTDALGTVTAYGIESREVDGRMIQGLKVSEVVTALDASSRATYYSYSHPTFHGLVTKQLTVSSNEDVMPSSITTTTLGAPSDAQGDNPGWWNEITQTTGTMGSGGTLGTALTSSTTVHDFAGGKRSIIDARGFLTNFDYDEHLRLTQVTHADGTHKDLAYDLHGNLVGETNENGVTTHHTYDKLNRRTQTTLHLSNDTDIVTSTTYNARNQVLTQTDPRGKVTTHEYDAAGHVTSTDDGGLVTEYQDYIGGGVFDSSGFKPRVVIAPSGVITYFEYDALYREVSRKVVYGQTPVINPRYLAYQADAAAKAAQQAAVDAATAASALQEITSLVQPTADQITAANDTLTNVQNAAVQNIAAANGSTLAVKSTLDAQNAALQTLGGAVGYANTLVSARNTYDVASAAADVAHGLVATASAALDEANQMKLQDEFYDTTSASLAYDIAVAATATTDQNKADAAVARDYAQTDMDNYVGGLQLTATEAHSNADNMILGVSSELSDAQSAYQLALSQLNYLDMSDPSYQDAQSAVDNAFSTMTLKQTAFDEVNGPYQAALEQAGIADAAVGAASSAPSALESIQQTQQAYSMAQQHEVDVGNQEASNIATATTAKTQAEQRHQTAVTASIAVQPAVAAASQAAASAATQAFNAATAESPEEAAEHASTAAAQAQIAHDNLTTAAAALAQLTGIPPQSGGSGSTPGTPPATMALPQTFTNTTYDALGHPLTVSDPLGHVTSSTYNGIGDLMQVTHADGTRQQITYTHTGKPWQVTDEMGNTTTTTYDAAGRAVMVQAPAVNGEVATQTSEYDAASNVIRVTDALGRETETEYDERNRPVAVYAPTVWDATTGSFVRPSSSTTYDSLGQVLAVTDPQGNVTTKFYDEAGRNWKVVAPVPEPNITAPTSITTFDAGGLALTVINPLGQTVINTYDIHGRLLTTVDAEGITNTFAYDSAGNRTSVKDGLNQETTFAYDGLNRLTSQTFANGDTWSYVFNEMQKVRQSSPRGITTHYAYDERNRLLTTSAPALSRTCTYDNAGHLLGVTEAGHAAAAVAYTYDALGRVITETSLGISHNYTYDLVGNRTHASYGTGRSVQTSYDALNRPELISEGGRVTRYGYDLGGRAVVLVSGNGQMSNNTYDNLGRLVDRTLFKTTEKSKVLAEFSWEHDALGNVTQQLEAWPKETNPSPGIRSTTMTYDGNNRLHIEEVTEDLSDPATGVTTTIYTYDNANNRSTKTVSGGSDPGVWSYIYNEANQLTSWEQSGTSTKSAILEYDGAGNRISQEVTGGATGNGINPPPAASGLTTYQWDAQDRLSSVTLPNGETHAYDYDYRTRRIGTHKLVSGVQQAMTAIVFAGGLSLAEYDSVTASLPASPTVEYTRGPDMGGGVGGMLYSLRGGTAKYSLSNGRGDIVAQADSSATLTWTASYEAYGRRTKETGSNQDKQRGNSKDEDPTGLLNEGFRYRDLETGVWLSRDPAGFVDGPNVYAYVTQNPWSKYDAEGLFWAYAVDAGFAIWDTASWATGHIDNKEYAKRMAITAGSVALNTASGGGFTGGGLVARALAKGGQVVARAEHVVKPLATISERAGASAVVQATSHMQEAADAGRAAGNAASDHGSQGSNAAASSGGPPPEPTITPKATAALNALKTPELVYRKGNFTDNCLTPRPIDIHGLSTTIKPPPGKSLVIDPAKLHQLEAVQDGANHASIRPIDMAKMKEWIASKGSDKPHELTTELKNAVLRKETH